MKILIAGAGIAGLAAARILKALSFPYHIIERAPALRFEGAGICLPMNASEALTRLGLFDKLALRGFKASEIIYADQSGEVLKAASLGVEPLNFYPFMGLHREILLSALSEGIDDINFNTTIQKVIAEESDGVVVELSDGATLKYDMIIGADGIYSNVRNHFFRKPDGATYEIADFSITTWRFIINIDTTGSQPIYFFGKGSVFMIYPISATQAYCYAQMIDPERKLKSKFDLQNLFVDFPEKVKRIVELVDEKDLIAGHLQSAPMLFRSKRVVLIGDAGHACAPMLQQGAALAIEDAFTLGRLAKEFGVEHALELYEGFRRPRIEWIVSRSNAGAVDISVPDDAAIIKRNEGIRAHGPTNIKGWQELFSMPSFFTDLENFINARKRALTIDHPRVEAVLSSILIPDAHLVSMTTTREESSVTEPELR